MATFVYSGVTYTAPAVGTTEFALTSDSGNAIPYLSQDHIYVFTSSDGQTWTTLTINTDYTFNSQGTEVVLNVGTVAGQQIRLQRKTPLSAQYVTFSDGSLLTSNQLNTAEQFSLYCDQELSDTGGGSGGGINVSTTDDLPEGNTNLYYTDARVESYVSGAGYIKNAGVTKIIAGTNIGITPASGTGEVTINAAGGGGSGGGIPEAPLDGALYARQSAGWTSFTVPAAQVQSDWDVTDSTSLAFIKNKPNWVQSDWSETDSSNFAFIKNKPTLDLQTICEGGNVTNTTIQAAGFRIDQLPTLP